MSYVTFVYCYMQLGLGVTIKIDKRLIQTTGFASEPPGPQIVETSFGIADIGTSGILGKLFVLVYIAYIDYRVECITG